MVDEGSAGAPFVDDGGDDDVDGAAAAGAEVVDKADFIVGAAQAVGAAAGACEYGLAQEASAYPAGRGLSTGDNGGVEVRREVLEPPDVGYDDGGVVFAGGVDDVDADGTAPAALPLHCVDGGAFVPAQRLAVPAPEWRGDVGTA